MLISRKIISFFLLVLVGVFSAGAASDVELKKTAFSLFDSSFKSIFGNSHLIDKQILSGCFKGHLRGRFLWVHLEELPSAQDASQGSSFASREVVIRYGEFFHRDNEGSPYVTFHGFNFESYSQRTKYSEICSRANGESGSICEIAELDFKKFSKYKLQPMVGCLSLPEGSPQ